MSYLITLNKVLRLFFQEQIVLVNTVACYGGGGSWEGEVTARREYNRNVVVVVVGGKQ